LQQVFAGWPYDEDRSIAHFIRPNIVWPFGMNASVGKGCTEVGSKSDWRDNYNVYLKLYGN
jgi:hypothetical protein